jgi:hypothetical protein
MGFVALPTFRERPPLLCDSVPHSTAQEGEVVVAVQGAGSAARRDDPSEGSICLPVQRAGFSQESFFHELLNERSLITFPRTSIAAIGHYFDPDAVPTWLAAAKVIAHRVA